MDQYFLDMDHRYGFVSQKIFFDTFGENGLLVKLNDIDIESIGTNHQTINASNAHEYVKKFMDLKNTNHTFWAGINARERAMIEPNYKTDNSYGIISLLFNFCSKLKTCGFDALQLTNISFAISRIYAAQTTGIAKIFISSDKPSEKTGLTVGTNLWEAELPVLWNLYHRGIITDIQLYIDDGVLYNSKWMSGVSMINDKINIPIYRRTWHYLDNDNTKSSFVQANMIKADYDKWRETPPRKAITTTKLKSIIMKWKKLK